MKEGVAGSLSIKTSVYNIIRLRLVCTWLSWHQHLKILAHAGPNFQAYLRIIVRYWEPCSGSTKSYKTYAPKTWVAAGMGKGEGHLPPPPIPAPSGNVVKCFCALVVTAKRSVDELFMQYFQNMSSASGDFTPRPLSGLHSWTSSGDFRPQTPNLLTAVSALCDSL